MIKRIIEISSQPMHISVQNEQLLLHSKAEKDFKTAVPCEDLGILLLEHPQTTLTQAAMAALAAYNVIVVFCGKDHLPCSLVIPISHNTLVVNNLFKQIEVSKPTTKKIWQQIVVAKIRAQADNLSHIPAIQQKLRVLANTVRSGDTDNHEAQAARLYWAAWLKNKNVPEASSFRRNPELPGINAMLNYGYAVLRAAVARAIVSAGLNPALGIHHKNRSNAFALADDLIEPLRPIVDHIIQKLVSAGKIDIDREVKSKLLAIVYHTVALEETIGPLMVILHRYTASYMRCLKREEKILQIPRDAENKHF